MTLECDHRVLRQITLKVVWRSHIGVVWFLDWITQCRPMLIRDQNSYWTWSGVEMGGGEKMSQILTRFVNSRPSLLGYGRQPAREGEPPS